MRYISRNELHQQHVHTPIALSFQRIHVRNPIHPNHRDTVFSGFELNLVAVVCVQNPFIIQVLRCHGSRLIQSQVVIHPSIFPLRCHCIHRCTRTPDRGIPCHTWSTCAGIVRRRTRCRSQLTKPELHQNPSLSGPQFHCCCSRCWSSRGRHDRYRLSHRVGAKRNPNRLNLVHLRRCCRALQSCYGKGSLLSLRNHAR